jgi:hypothetical protein
MVVTPVCVNAKENFGGRSIQTQARFQLTREEASDGQSAQRLATAGAIVNRLVEIDSPQARQQAQA